ncbi:MAG: NAD-dependent epimerase/dehydratase family protein [Phycisphaerales bacterium]
MRLLVLGGTVWLGQLVARIAHAQGHHVTCLARGSTTTPPDGTRFVRADRDRDDAYDDVAQEDWDAVFDVARQPGHVRRAVAALADRCGTYIFVSSISVYESRDALGADESAALLPAHPSDVMESLEFYGQAKVAAEEHVRRGVGADRAMLLRAGLIGGDGDDYDRLGYWPMRFDRAAHTGRAVLVPDVRDISTQVIDVHDLAEWVVRSAVNGTAGTFDAVGEIMRFEDRIRVAQRVAEFDGPITWVDPAWLIEQGVRPWMGPKSLPLWVPMPESAGLCARPGAAARAAGLTLRPALETMQSALAYERTRTPPAERRAGLTDAEEAELLAAWSAYRGAHA